MRPLNADSLLIRVRELMLRSEFLTPLEICNLLGIDRAKIGSVSSRLRDLATLKYGGYEKVCRKVSNGVYEYKIRPASLEQQKLFKTEDKNV